MLKNKTARIKLAGLASLSCATLILPTTPVQADENLWGYVYGSETLPVGATESYLWLTNRRGKADGDYSAYDYQIELEHGFTDRFQSSFYLTGSTHDHSGVTGLSDTDRTTLDGAKVSFKYAFLSPYKDGIGFALYAEPGYSRTKRVSGESFKKHELELKALLQKNFLDDQLIAAYNLTWEFEREEQSGVVESELEVVHSAGLSWRFAPAWYTGLELQHHSAYPGFDTQEYAVWSAGPNIHYGGKQWWATLTWLPQISGRPDTKSGLELDHNERQEIRLKLGYDF